MNFEVGDIVYTPKGIGKIISVNNLSYGAKIQFCDGDYSFYGLNAISLITKTNRKEQKMSIKDAFNCIKQELETNPEYFELWEQQIKNLRLKTNTSCEMLEKMFDIKKPQNTLKKRTLKDYHE